MSSRNEKQVTVLQITNFPTRPALYEVTRLKNCFEFRLGQLLYQKELEKAARKGLDILVETLAY